MKLPRQRPVGQIAARAGASTSALSYACLAGVTAAATLAWLSQDERDQHLG